MMHFPPPSPSLPPDRRSLRGLLSLCVLVFCFFAACAQLPESLGDEKTSKEPSVSDASSLDSSGDAGDSREDARQEKTKQEVGAVQLAENGTIRYTLGWSWKGATWNASTKSYHFTSSLGIEYRIAAAYSNLSVVQMVPCDSSTRRRTPEIHTPSLWDWVLPRSARADHSYDNDASWLARITVEAWLKDNNVLFGDGKASGKRYCKLHALWTSTNQQASDGFTLPSKSLWFKGSYRTKESQDWRPLQASIHLQQGSLLDLQVPSALQKGEHKGVEVQLLRQPVQAFDTLNPAQENPIDLAYNLLRKVGQTSVVLVKPLP